MKPVESNHFKTAVNATQDDSNVRAKVKNPLKPVPGPSAGSTNILTAARTNPESQKLSYK